MSMTLNWKKVKDLYKVSIIFCPEKTARTFQYLEANLDTNINLDSR